jgi:Ca-activated chloride channel family protein
LGAATTIAAADHGEKRAGKWLQTSASPSLIFKDLRSQTPSSSEGRASVAALELVGRIAAWSLLGGLLGLGMTFFVPNLKTWRALLGGAIGGLVGSLGFLAGAGVVADFAGRLLGAALLGFFIGLMIALVERLVREACLLVHWGPKETTTVNLGARSIILGSSPEAHIYLPKEKGFAPVTGLVSFTGGKVEFENKISGQKHALQNGSKVQLGTVVVEVRTVR